VNSATNIRATSSFSKKYNVVKEFMEKMGPVYGGEDDIKLLWQHLQTKYVKDQTRIISYENIKGAIISDPKHIQHYFEEGLRMFHGEIIGDDKRFFRQLKGSASHHHGINNNNSIMSQASENSNASESSTVAGAIAAAPVATAPTAGK
jgi:hypothetical protein